MTMKLTNISGEPREFGHEGFIYEFPNNAEEPTEVPDVVGKKLMTTGHYIESSSVKKKEIKLIEEPEEVNENAI